MFNWYNFTGKDVVAILNSDSYSGLKEEEIKNRREKYGSNSIDTLINWKNDMRIITLLKKPWVYFIMFNGIFCLIEKSYFVALFNLSVLAFYILYFKFLEDDKKKNLKGVSSYDVNVVQVIRNSGYKRIEAKDLVVGDIVILKSGDIIPADLRIIESEKLRINENFITGKKKSVEKINTKIYDENPQIDDINNMLFKNSKVTSGEATAVVVECGDKTEAWRIIKSIKERKEHKSVMINKLETIMNLFCGITIVLILVFYITGMHKEKSLHENIIVINNLIFLCIPLILIPMFFSIMYTWQRVLSRNGVVLKNIFSFEKLAEIDYIFLNKRGFITAPKTNLEKIYTDGQLYKADKDLEYNDNISRIFNIGILCNDFEDSILDNSKEFLYKDKAMQDYYYKKLKGPKEKIIDNKLLFKIRNNSNLNVRISLNSIDENYRASVRGNLIDILDTCTHIMKNGTEKEITEADIRNIKQTDLKLISEGLDVEAFAYRNFKYEPSSNENILSNMVFVGLVAYHDEEAKSHHENMDKLRRLIIKPILVSLENKITASTLASRLNIFNSGDKIFTGVEMDFMGGDELNKLSEKITVVSNVNENHKLRLISSLSNLGHKVASIGIKAKDSIFLTKCNLSIAIDNESSTFIKNNADVIIEKRDLGGLVRGISLSRRIIFYINKTIRYIISLSICQIIYISLYICFNYNFPSFSYRLALYNSLIYILGAIFINFNCRLDEIMLYQEIEKANNQLIDINTLVKAIISAILAYSFSSIYDNYVLVFVIIHLLYISTFLFRWISNRKK